MIYALLVAVSSVTPAASVLPTLTATIAPTATPIPTPTASPLPVFVSIVDAPGFWEIAGILSSVILGLVALIVSVNAYRFTKQQQKREEDMRQREAKIEVMDKAFSVYNFFIKEIHVGGYFNFGVMNDTIIPKVHRIQEVEYLAKLLFKNETYDKIYIETRRILFMFVRGNFPTISDENRVYKNLDEVLDEIPPDIKYEVEEMERRKQEYFNLVEKNVNEIFEQYRLNL